MSDKSHVIGVNSPNSEPTLATAFTFDQRTAQSYEIYRKTFDIYRRIQVALGRVQKYRVTVGSTTQTFPTNERKTSL